MTASAPALGGRRSSGIPFVAAAIGLFAAATNVLAALSPDIPPRAGLLLRAEPVLVPVPFHAAGLAVGGSLALVSLYLLKRRRRAAQVAVGLLAWLAASTW